MKKILQRARKLLAKGWCQGPMAKNEFGDVPHWNSSATHFCVYGAVKRAARELLEFESYSVMAYLDKLVIRRSKGRYTSAIAYSEAPTRRKAHVLALLDKAIKEVA